MKKEICKLCCDRNRRFCQYKKKHDMTSSLPWFDTYQERPLWVRLDEDMWKVGMVVCPCSVSTTSFDVRGQVLEKLSAPSWCCYKMEHDVLCQNNHIEL